MAKVALLPGDGIGPEVIAEGRRVLEALNEQRGRGLEFWELDLGAERFLKDGTTFPKEIFEEIRDSCDAVLLGALGDPRVPNLNYARDILFGLRFGLELYCNIRPVVCLDDSLMPLRDYKACDCNFTVFRENTEGIYVNVGGTFKEGTPDEVATNQSINTRKGVERIVVAAFEHAKKVGAKTVHMADKHNAMKHAHGLWKRCFFEVAERYPDIEAKHLFVDALCYFMVRDPSQFEVIVTSNLFGDIITDLGAAFQGGLGMAASANVHPGKVSMFEPVHGSAPDIAKQNKANPIATMLSVGMMMSHLGFPEDEKLLLDVVEQAITEKKTTVDLGGTLSTTEVGDFFVAKIVGD